MLIILFRRAAICQSVEEVYMTGVAPLGAVKHRFLLTVALDIVENFFPPNEQLRAHQL